MVPQIHGQNLETLQRMLGIPISMKAIPPEVVERVLKAQKCIGRCSLSEALPDYVLLCLCYDFQTLPKSVPTKYGHLKDGDTIYFKVNEFEWQPCTFRAVADPQMHTYHIYIWGENRTAPENMLRETHPGDVPVESEPVPVAPSSEADTKDAESESERDAELQAQRLEAAQERLKSAFPKDKAVDCSIPGEEFFQGVVIGHGNGRWAGTINVRPSTEKGNGYRRVPAEHVSASSAALV